MHARTILLGLLVAAGTQLQADEPKKQPAPTEAELTAIWAELISIDDLGSQRAFAGMKRMIAAPEVSVPFLRQRLKPAQALDAKKIEKLLTELDDDNFQTRERAYKQLRELGTRALGAIRARLAKNPGSLESKELMTKLVKQSEQEGVSADDLRGVRAVFVLQEIGTDEARAILTTLAGGAGGDLTAEQARKALKTLAAAKAP